MTGARDRQRLEELAQLILDQRLSQVRDASARLERSRMQLAAVNQTGEARNLPMTTIEKVGLTYQRWADGRRSELNLVIARQSAEWHEARGEAARALGRHEALRALLKTAEKDR